MSIYIHSIWHLYRLCRLYIVCILGILYALSLRVPRVPSFGIYVSHFISAIPGSGTQVFMQREDITAAQGGFLEPLWWENLLTETLKQPHPFKARPSLGRCLAKASPNSVVPSGAPAHQVWPCAGPVTWLWSRRRLESAPPPPSRCPEPHPAGWWAQAVRQPLDLRARGHGFSTGAPASGDQGRLIQALARTALRNTLHEVYQPKSASIFHVNSTLALPPAL